MTLQAGYTVVRNGSEVKVPLHDLTDAELEAIACNLDRDAEALEAHVAELASYVDRRAPPTAD